MSKVEICDLCKKPVLARYTEAAYKFIVKRRWFNLSETHAFRREDKQDVCGSCMRKIIGALPASNPRPSKESEK